VRSGAAIAGCGRGGLDPLLVAVDGLGVMGSDLVLEALQAQRTHRSDGLEVGVETHQHRVVIQSHGGHQEVEAHDGPAAAWVPLSRA